MLTLGYNFGMKKRLLIIVLALFLSPAVFAENGFNFFKLHISDSDTREIKSLLQAQVRYANKTNFKKFIATYDKSYVNSDGFDLETYSNIVKDVWDTYDNVVYGVKIKDISIDDNAAKVEVTETSYADIPASQKLDGILQGESESVYYLKKINGDWKVVSDKVLSESTSMLYGTAKDLDIKLSAPLNVKAGEEYTASLEFTPPENVIAIASIASDKVEYPQKQAKEVFRKLPEDNILERLFISNSENANEYVVASIGLTQADIDDLSIKLSLTGFGYKIIRVNVLPNASEDADEKDK